MSYEKEIQRLCSVPENLRSHWPPELLWAVQAFEDLEKRAIRLSERLDFLEESLEQREYCDSVLQEYEQKFFSVNQSSFTLPPAKSRTAKTIRTKGQCRY